MSWQLQLKEFEKKKDWVNAIQLMKKTVANNPDDCWVYVQAIYLFHNILLEEDYPKEEEKALAELLKEYFIYSKDKFSEDPEYLFFMGKILHVAEWYFGLDDNSLAFQFQEKAKNKEPNNLLYAWAYWLSCGDPREAILARQLIENEKDMLDWLSNKGSPGEYVLEHLKMSYERNKE
jgi:hypothetical protein